MTTREDVRETAALFSWEVNPQNEHDILLHGENMIDVLYDRDGSVNTAERFHFFSINDLHLIERATGQSKKAQVISWLAELA